eukprot:gnl/TRDRNA2_/TRDRNA2_131284_c1_seq2.p1 gnl/TRDRNA2_/TRDRNA2_131284_c1~~gnl/TRDRNA2_/TRDRNA2_131284_c1_seq2.p1  ORF type:complete len:108 (-),score=13.53 gnl/TRDRNA2_/TRDRNA2_131284_c1_seq2:81-404(-)
MPVMPPSDQNDAPVSLPMSGPYYPFLGTSAGGYNMAPPMTGQPMQAPAGLTPPNLQQPSMPSWSGPSSLLSFGQIQGGAAPGNDPHAVGNQLGAAPLYQGAGRKTPW